ncbi:unnamed protein product [Angiostrongylus costaricensis]|uniref:protein acetyllysine N-acetyltransferase n=1 Tax=Angiostrongylus costaricensis TaxID=334426 RepID=A0A0R3P9V8_ANGCS|nr:unnamed protein product [Angiostrongylus costaricensis]
MSINYAQALSPYENKGAVGMPEVRFIPIKDFTSSLHCKTNVPVSTKNQVTRKMSKGRISTSAGIPDFRGPNGVWTTEKDGRVPESVDFTHARPTFTHHALRVLEERGLIRCVRLFFSSIPRLNVQGNTFCCCVGKHYYRNFAIGSVGLKYTGRTCEGNPSGRTCRGRLRDTTLDWEDNTSSLFQNADLSLCLGTSLQIVPVGDMPLLAKRNGGKMVTVNLQATKHVSSEKVCFLYIRIRNFSSIRICSSGGANVAREDGIYLSFY